MPRNLGSEMVGLLIRGFQIDFLVANGKLWLPFGKRYGKIDFLTASGKKQINSNWQAARDNLEGRLEASLDFHRGLGVWERLAKPRV